MVDTVSLLIGLMLMTWGDINLVRFGERGWIDLDNNSRKIFGKDDGQLKPQDVAISLQIWAPIFGIIAFFFFFRATLDIVIEVNIPDLIVVLLYVVLFGTVFYVPGELVHRASVFWTERYAARRTVRAGRLSDEKGHHGAETLWRSVIAIGFLATAISLLSILDQLPLFGVPLGLFFLKTRLDYRTRHLTKSRSAEAAARRLDDERPDKSPIVG